MMVAGRPWYLARSTSSGRLPLVTCATQAGDRTEGALAGTGDAGPAPLAACWRDRVSTAGTWALSLAGWGVVPLLAPPGEGAVPPKSPWAAVPPPVSPGTVAPG